MAFRWRQHDLIFSFFFFLLDVVSEKLGKTYSVLDHFNQPFFGQHTKMLVFRILLSYYFVISLDGSSSRIQLISNVHSQLINTRRNEMGKFMTVPRTSTWSTEGRSIRVAQCLGLMNLPMKNQPPLISSFTLSVSMDIIIVTLVLISS